MDVFETNEDRDKQALQRREEERAWRASLGNMKAGSHVVMRSAYGDGKQKHVRKVLKVTATQIITDSYGGSHLHFHKDDGYEAKKYGAGRLVRFAVTEEIAQYEDRKKKEEADKVENARVKSLCDAAMAKLQPILGPNVKVMRWTTKEDGTLVFKIEAENMTEDDVKNIISRI